MLRIRLVIIGTFALFVISVAFAQQPSAPTPPANPLSAPPDANTFSDPFFAAPGTRVLPGGTEMPPPVPEAMFGPAADLPKYRVWATTDFYLAAGRGTIVPPLLTAGPVGSSGALFGDGTRIAFGDQRMLQALRPALRAEAGVWFGESQTWGLDGGFVYLPEKSRSVYAEGGPGTRVIARPVFDAATGTEVAAASSADFPTAVAARVATVAIGGDANLRYNLRRDEFGRVDLLAGYRYLHLEDAVEVGSRQDTPAGGVFTDDWFLTRNDFHGPQVGLATTHRLFARLTLELRATVALGVTVSRSIIEGGTDSPLGSTGVGLLAAGSNSRRDTSYDFAVLPEGTVRLGYDITDRINVHVGYTLLYWSDVRRAADQIDRAVNAPDRPAFPDRHTAYWIQGVTLGGSLRY